MDAFKNIISRRSIRKFTSQPVDEKTCDKLLEAAMYAPSARNTQSWNFVVINDRCLLDRLSEIHPYAQMLRQAPLAILLCGDKSLESIEGYLCVNCAAATQNILLAAHYFGLGSVWLGVYPREERMKDICSLLNLPDDTMPVSLIAIGWPDEKKTHPQRYFNEKIHYNDRW
jgi:nitroreductase